MIKILIIEDEFNVVKIHQAYLAKHYTNIIEVVGTAEDVKEAAQKINALQPQLLLLDINLRTGSGFDLLKLFPNPFFKVIFISGLHDKALEAIKSQALDFVTKPVKEEDFIHAIEKAREELKKEAHLRELEALIHNFTYENKKLRIPYQGGAHFVAIDNIIYLEADAAWTYFYLTNSKTKICSGFNIKNYQNFLVETGKFFRIHNSYIINKLHLKEFKNDKDNATIIMENGTELPVSRQRKRDFLTWLEE